LYDISFFTLSCIPTNENHIKFGGFHQYSATWNMVLKVNKDNMIHYIKVCLEMVNAVCRK
jgi:hypothetical protein